MKTFNINEESCKYYAILDEDSYVIVDEYAMKDYHGNISAEYLGVFETLQDAEEWFYNSND